MYNFILDMWDSTLEFMQMWPYYLQNLDVFYEDYVEFLLKHLTNFSFWFAERSLNVAYEITDEFLSSFNYQDNMQSAWNMLPDTSRAILGYLRLPECINIVISALGTKFVMRFIPFIH